MTSQDAPSSVRRSGPCALVIYGASGDLTRRKLVPALYNLARQGLVSEGLAVVGIARREGDTAAFRTQMREQTEHFAGDEFDPGAWDWLESRLHHLQGSYEEAGTFERLVTLLRSLQDDHGTGGNALHYLATRPEAFGGIVDRLAAVGLTSERNGCWSRVIVEKPFGSDLESARVLNAQLLKSLGEQQIYRIDHYLGKETVQNLLVFRFANGIFEPIWNRRYVDHVQITVAETLGVEGRGGYYDTAGALRDMVPNHLFQLISLVAMEPPISFEADAVRDEQSKVLRSIQPMSPEDVLHRTVRGQYGAGRAGGRELPAYRSEDRVASDSTTETFVAMKLAIDNWRWKDVPFYLRVGKAMPRRLTEISVQFKRPPFAPFRDTPVESLQPNQLVVNVQPDEGISLHFGAKTPGATMRIAPVNMHFNYADHFGVEMATGYERLLYDAIIGDQTLFRRKDMVEESWKVVQPVLDVWQALNPRDFPNYSAGSWGPSAAADLLGRDKRAWRAIEG